METRNVVVAVSSQVGRAAMRSLERLATKGAFDELRLVDESRKGSLDLADASVYICRVPIDDDEIGLLIQRVRQLRSDIVIVGTMVVPDQSRWYFAERAGFDMVCNEGSVASALARKLEDFETGGRQSFPLCSADEHAGRLGLLGRFEVPKIGWVALWRSGSRLGCLEDRCPHLGAPLSEGEVEEGVVTCPWHGSQFDTKSGERLRGPADEDVKRFEVYERDGRIWLAL